MGHLMQDIRYGYRSLRSRPGLTLAIAGILALGIGANTVIFSMADALLFRQLPGLEDPERLVRVGRTQEGEGFDTFGVPDFRYYADQTQRFQSLAAVRGLAFTVGTDGSASRVGGALVTGSYFPTLGTGPEAGRLLGPGDVQEMGGRPVAVVSSRFARERWGGAREAVGQSLRVNGIPLEVAGVTPPGFRGDELLARYDIWVPLTMQPIVWPIGADLFESAGSVWLNVFGRLAPGADREGADAELAGLSQRLRSIDPEAYEGRGAVTGDGIALSPGWRRDIAGFTGMLQVVVLLVLLIAAANVANLLLVRASDREREMGVRLALGAGRWRLFRQLLVESLMLSLIGAAGALLIAVWGADILRWALSVSPIGSVVASLDFGVDLRLLLFTLAAGLLTGVVFGLVPSVRASRADPTRSLKEAGSTGGGGGSRFRSVLVTGQIALSLVLLAGSGLFVRTLMSYGAVDPGFDAARVGVVETELTDEAYPGPQAMAFYREAVRRIERLPGVERATLGYPVPLDGSSRDTRIQVPGVQSPEDRGWPTNVRMAVPGYLQTLGITLLRGSGLDEDTPRGVVVSRAMADRFWPGQDPLGKTFWPDFAGPDGAFTVTGVAETTRYRSLDEDQRPHFYRVPDPQGRRMAILFRAEDPAAVSGQVIDLIRGMDPNLPLFGIRTLEEQLNRSIGGTRVAAGLAGVFALLALILAAVGLYGALAYYVRRRTREIGIRLALGAARGKVVGLVIRQGSVLALTGMLIGLPAGFAAAGLIRDRLYGVEPFDPVTFLMTSLLLLAVAAAAAWIPARRAARLDPASTLRHE